MGKLGDKKWYKAQSIDDGPSIKQPTLTPASQHPCADEPAEPGWGLQGCCTWSANWNWSKSYALLRSVEKTSDCRWISRNTSISLVIPPRNVVFIRPALPSHFRGCVYRSILPEFVRTLGPTTLYFSSPVDRRSTRKLWPTRSRILACIPYRDKARSLDSQPSCLAKFESHTLKA